ncbi:MAG: 30S ribosomal protein S20 [Planctomycetota bacterium]|nr:30S ribosomal protein S20 [Planctomycetota bacterium]
MPNTTSAKKRVRQGADRAERNKLRRTSMRTAIRKLKEAVEAGDKAQASGMLVEVYQRIDKAAKVNIIHQNTAGNRKSRLTRMVNRMA